MIWLLFWRPRGHCAGRDLRPTAVFDTYWRFAAARQQVYEARLVSERRRGPPSDLAAHRFASLTGI
jgi:hypothetical protein